MIETTKEYVVMLEDVAEVLVSMQIEEKPPINDEIQPIETNLLSNLLNLKVLPACKGFEALHNLSSTSTTNCFAPMLKRKLDRYMMQCDDHLRCFSEMLRNWHWMSSVQNSCIYGKWLCITWSNNEVWTISFVKKIAHLTGMHTSTGAYLSGRLLYIEFSYM